jgi:hypothetical protein
MPLQAVVTAELSRLIGVSVDRIVRAHRSGRLPEVGRAGCHRIYAVPDEVEMVRKFFFGGARQDDGRRPTDG